MTRLHRRLLQHELAHEHAPRAEARAAPRQVARIRPVPRDQRRREVGHAVQPRHRDGRSSRCGRVPECRRSAGLGLTRAFCPSLGRSPILGRSHAACTSPPQTARERTRPRISIAAPMAAVVDAATLVPCELKDAVAGDPPGAGGVMRTRQLLAAAGSQTHRQATAVVGGELVRVGRSWLALPVADRTLVSRSSRRVSC